MKNNVIIAVLSLIAILAGTYLLLSSKEPVASVMEEEVIPEESEVVIEPISHASFVFTLAGIRMFNDPVGEVSAYTDKGTPDIILLSDIHGDHLNTETLEALITAETKIIAPQAVFDELTPALQAKTIVMANGETLIESGINFEAIPMYNLPEAEDSRDRKSVV